MMRKFGLLLPFLAIAQTACSPAPDGRSSNVEMKWKGARLDLPRSAITIQGANLTTAGKQFFLTQIDSGNVKTEEFKFTPQWIHIGIFPITDVPKLLGPFEPSLKTEFHIDGPVTYYHGPIKLRIDPINKGASISGVSAGTQEALAILNSDALDATGGLKRDHQYEVDMSPLSLGTKTGLYRCGGAIGSALACQMVYTYKGFYISAYWNLGSTTTPFAVGMPIPDVARLIDRNVRIWIR